jgi:4-alpha-glucanotransferase
MGLVRQYWIPAGAPADQGAYVRVATDDLFGILALESHRAGALIVGEDLGTVPPELPALLARWGVLSTRVLYFERDRRGGYRPASQYPKRALVSANTHDLAPVMGFLEGHDLDQRAALGLFASNDALAHAKSERQRDARAMMQRISGTKQTPATPAAATDRIHGFLSRTPAALLGIALDDLGAEREPVNVPGVGVDRHPSWSRRMQRSLESLRADDAVARSLRSVRARRWKKGRGAR